MVCLILAFILVAALLNRPDIIKSIMKYLTIMLVAFSIMGLIYTIGAIVLVFLLR